MADNPNWKTILDVLPESLHEIVKPALLQWDQGVQQKLESVREEYKGYDAYKEFVEQGIDPQYVQQSVQLADAIRDNPDDMVSRISATYNLGYAKPDPNAANSNHSLEDDEDFDMTGDITKHPVVQQLTQALEELKGQVGEFTSTQQEREQAAEYETYMNSLHDQHGAFDDIFVGAYLSNGYTPEDAIEAYRKAVAQSLNPANGNNNNEGQGQADANNGSTPPPVVLDGSGTGSGTEQPVVDFGAMRKTNVNDLVEDMLKQAANQ